MFFTEPQPFGDAERDTESQLIPDPLGGDVGVWSPDGRVLVWAGSNGNLYRKEVLSGGTPELILKGGLAKEPSDWSRDARYLVFTAKDPKTNGDIRVLPDPGGNAGITRPYPFQRTEAIESQAWISPDGRWIAYTSNESSSNEVYVRPFPSGRGRWKVPVGYGSEPRWRSDGRAVLLDAGNSAALSFDGSFRSGGANGSFAAGQPQPLFEHRISNWMTPFTRGTYSPGPDGQRFLVLSRPVEQETIHVLYNWTQMVREKE
jgi:Tol biopolymer transport system component